MRTGAEFLEGIKKRNYNIYHLGKKIENPTEYPMLKWPLKVVARIHDLALDPKHSDLLTATSPITGDKVNRFLHVFGSIDDLLIRQKKMRFLITHLGSCCLMCPGLGGVNALYSTTYDMDKELGTNYHQRFMDYIKYVQENDLFLAGAMMDVKGNRSQNAFEQADPDMYLHIVEERDDGIVVRGAKAHQTGPMIADEVVIMPCDIMRDPKARDYAVSFAIPADTKGLTYIMQQNLADALTDSAEGTDGMDLGNVRYGCQFGATALMVFDDVFVPKERIFMQGEYKYTSHLITRMGTLARMWQTGCRPGIFDLITGATKLIAEYNGVAKAPHVIDKLTEMSFLTETVWGLALACASFGKPVSNGAYLPDPLLTNVAKLQSTRNYYELVKIAIDLCGGLIVSVPSEKDCKNPETGKWIDKYFRGVADVPTEHRLRVVRFIQSLTGGPVAAALHHSGGPMQNQKIVIYRETDFNKKTKRVKVLAGIEEEEF